MSALQFLKSGDLSKALTSLQDEVRNNPSEPKHRIFLFQLYALMGESGRALNQLNVLRDLSKDAMTLVQTYQEALQCDSLREDVYDGKRTPLVFGQPEDWIAMMVNALTMAENVAAASELRALALEQATAVPGTLTFYPNNSVNSADGAMLSPGKHKRASSG